MNLYCHRIAVKRRAALAVVIASGMILSSSSIQAAPAASNGQTPPEIAEILQKVNKGQQMTKSDVAKMQVWSTTLMDEKYGPMRPFQTSNLVVKHPRRVTKPFDDPQGIPCSIHVDVEYHAEMIPGSELYKANFDAMVILYPHIAGTGDYWAPPGNSNSPASSFRFEPYASYGVLTPTGSGTFERYVMNVFRHTYAKGDFTNTICSMLLVTTGKGDLLFPSGSIAGTSSAEFGASDRSGASVAFIDNDASTPSIGIPFPLESNSKDVYQSPSITEMKLSYSSLVAAIKSGKTETITATETFKEFQVRSIFYTGHSTITITLRPKAQ